MLIPQRPTPSLRQAKEMNCVFSHPSSGHLLDLPMWVPAELLDGWTSSAIDVANNLSLQCPTLDRYGLFARRATAEPINHRCLSVDFAITESEGFDISLVEVQSFPSLMHHALRAESIYAPHSTLGGYTWQERRNLLRDTVQQGFGRENAIILDSTVVQQRTFMDFFAASEDVTPVSLDDLYENNGNWYYFQSGRSHQVKAIYSRIVYEQLTESARDVVVNLLNARGIRWLNHPSSFYAYSKASLLALEHPLNPVSVPAQWPLPEGTALEDWVLKPLYGLSGKGVDLAPTENSVRAAMQEGAMMQRKLRYAPCLRMPNVERLLCAEIRFMLLKTDQGQWVPIATLVRTSWDGNISQSMRLNRQGEGATIACRYVPE